MTPQGMGTPLTFLYGNNGSAGSLSGVSDNSTAGQGFHFYQNEPPGLTAGNPNPNLGTFAGQPSAPTDTSSNFFTYPTGNTPTASDNGINQATGGIGGYNPLGYNQTNTSTLSGTDSALGYSAAVNPITGDTQANTNQTNPALQALTQSRQPQSFSGGFS
jgi:hypothetical protein